MLAAVLEDVNFIGVREIVRPQLTAGSALLKVHSCGFCGSDLKFITSRDRIKKYPAILGHEIAGEIVAIDKGIAAKFKKGDRVAMAAEVPCLNCVPCHKGLFNLCDDVLSIGTTISGGFCEYMLLTPEMITRGPINTIPDTVTYDEAALAESLGCVINGLEFARMSREKTVLIIGTGYMGCLTINMARQMGAKTITVVDNNPQRIEQAKGFQPDHTVRTQETESFVGTVMDLVDNAGYDVVMTTCSDIGVYNQAVLTAAKGGFVNLFGGIKKGLPDTVAFSNNFVHYRGISMGGSFSATRDHHKKALDCLEKGVIETDRLITHRFKLAEFDQALTVAKKQEGLKVMINP
ncbi:MAG: alcohol dehydrogenase catalytic domain-containing protein [Deltaproteobacteria bacterium]|nr:alcohol dehydrogenase catalytic domain-containing protein [Deltaproteobacteria bacterium]